LGRRSEHPLVNERLYDLRRLADAAALGWFGRSAFPGEGRAELFTSPRAHRQTHLSDIASFKSQIHPMATSLTSALRR